MILVESTSAAVGDLNPDSVAVLPLGAVEQHSLHLPLGTDSLISAAIAGELENRNPDAVVLFPPTWIGASDHHLAMAGSVSTGTTALVDSITRTISSFRASSRIRKFLLLNGHGGNQPAVSAIIESIVAAQPTSVCWGANYWDAMFDVLDERAVPRPTTMGHADTIETSLLLHLRPELVHMDRATPDGYTDGLPGWLRTSAGIPERTRHGGVGDPTSATAQAGEVLFEAALDGISRLVELLKAI